MTWSQMYESAAAFVTFAFPLMVTLLEFRSIGADDDRGEGDLAAQGAFGCYIVPSRLRPKR
jgi:hypothetical protein